MNKSSEGKELGEPEYEELDFTKLSEKDRREIERVVQKPVLEAAIEIADYAHGRHMTVHPSTVVELENYARHVGVSSLPSERIRKVLIQLGRDAVEHTAAREERALNAGAIRLELTDQCNDPFSDCQTVAQQLLADEEW